MILKMENSVKVMHSERDQTLIFYKIFTFRHYRKVKSTDEQVEDARTRTVMPKFFSNRKR